MRIISEVSAQDGIDNTDKDASVREPVGNRFVVSVSMLHAGCGFTVRILVCLIRALIADWACGISHERKKVQSA